MSAVLSHPTLRASLEALECHFTWELGNNRSNLLHLRDTLDDIGTEEGNPWQGHIHNLQGHVHFQLASQGEALRCFGTAAEAFRQVRNTVSDEGPWLLVNYANLAWLHYHMGEQATSLAYVGKVEALLREYPSPILEQLHQEVLAEKAWTFMHFSLDCKRKAVEYFTKAIEVEPDMVEWTTSHALALFKVPEQEANILETLRRATERDPDNLYIAAVYLGKFAETGGAIRDEAQELAKRVLKKPQSVYSGIRPLLRLYRLHVSLDEAIDVAEEALERHPTRRHLKSGLASCYKWKIYSDKDSPQIQSLRKRAIVLHEEIINLYPHTSLVEKITLANLYGESTHHDKMEGDMIFKDLLENEFEPPQMQMLYNKYAHYLNYYLKDRYRSIQYHMKAAAILHPSSHRKSSIRILTQIKNRRMSRMCGEVEDFLANLKEEEPITY